MKSFFWGVVALGLVFSWADGAAAQGVLHKTSALQLVLPKGWTAVPDKDDPETLVITSPKQDVDLFLFTTDETDAAKFVKGIDAELGEFLKDVKVTQKATSASINGLAQTWMSGTAKLDQEPVQWDLSLVLGGKKSLVVVAIGNITLNRQPLETIYDSIKKK